MSKSNLFIDLYSLTGKNSAQKMINVISINLSILYATPYIRNSCTESKS